MGCRSKDKKKVSDCWECSALLYAVHTVCSKYSMQYVPEKLSASPSLIGWVGGRSCVAMVEAEVYASSALAALSLRISPFWN